MHINIRTKCKKIFLIQKYWTVKNAYLQYGLLRGNEQNCNQKWVFSGLEHFHQDLQPWSPFSLIGRISLLGFQIWSHLPQENFMLLEHNYEQTNSSVSALSKLWNPSDTRQLWKQREKITILDKYEVKNNIKNEHLLNEKCKFTTPKMIKCHAIRILLKSQSCTDHAKMVHSQNLLIPDQIQVEVLLEHIFYSSIAYLLILNLFQSWKNVLIWVAEFFFLISKLM